jgi:signal transduction histidine kinase
MRRQRRNATTRQGHRHFLSRGGFREAFIIPNADCILAGRSIETELAATRRFAAWLVAGGFAVLALGLGGVWWLAGRAPARAEISAAATPYLRRQSRRKHQCSETDNELGQLADTLNSTFGRLESAFAHQKQFTADASHELRRRWP